MINDLLRFALAGLFLVTASPVFAQPTDPSGWSFTVDGGFAVQGDADLEAGSGSFSIDRRFFSAGVDYRWNYRNSIGLSAGGGTTEYDFEDADGEVTPGPWADTDDRRVSLSGRFALGQTSTLFVVPTLRYNGEDGADSGDSRNWGAFGGVAWRLSDTLTLGPGLGVFTRLEGSARVFPILLIDWDFAERWNLSTGRGLAASQGPGLTLSYALTPTWRLGLAGRYEEVQFRLDEEGPAPGGVGEDRTLPLVLTAAWSPNPRVRLGVFAGLEFMGELNLYDVAGRTVQSRDYDTTPVYGATFEFRL